MPWQIVCTMVLLLAVTVLPPARVNAAAPVVTSAATAAPVDANLLFAGLDGAFSFQRADLAGQAIQSELIGIIVDGEEFGTELVYRLGEAYYLPATDSGADRRPGCGRNGRFYLETPGGEVETGPTSSVTSTDRCSSTPACSMRC